MSLLWILRYVIAAGGKMGPVAHNRIERFRHPQRSGLVHQPVDLVTGIRLPRMQDRIDGMRPQRFHNDVNVIWHDNERIDHVSIPIEMLEALADDLLRTRIPQQTGALTLIQPLLAFLFESLHIFARRFPVPRMQMML